MVNISIFQPFVFTAIFCFCSSSKNVSGSSVSFIALVKARVVLPFVVIAPRFCVLFFDTFNIIDRVKNTQKIHQLEKEIEYYNNLIENDKQRIHELQSDDRNLEKFAREQFLMKQENEDIFIIDEE